MESFSINKRIKSFGYVFNGFRMLINDEHNSRIHLLAATSACLLGVTLQISPSEWIAVVIAIGFVFSSEILNTAIEHIANFISPSTDDRIKKIKDLSAASVLVSSITALCIGVIVFLPKVLNWFGLTVII